MTNVSPIAQSPFCPHSMLIKVLVWDRACRTKAKQDDRVGPGFEATFPILFFALCSDHISTECTAEDRRQRMANAQCRGPMKNRSIVQQFKGVVAKLAATACSFHHRATSIRICPSSQLGQAQSFAVLGGSTVTNTGPTIVVGDLGVSPGTAVTGFPPGTVTGGTIHAADAVALQAQADTTAAYVDLAGRACDTTFGVPTDLAGMTLVPGVYCFSSSASLTGALTLDGGGNVDAVWIFKVGSTLITGSNSSVLLINGGQQCNDFWQVGSSATLGTGYHVRGKYPGANEH